MTREKIYFITPEGGSLDLTDDTHYMVRQGIDGRRMPPFTFVSDKMFTYPGEVVRGIQTEKREITLPITIYGDDADDFRQNARFLAYSLDPMRGEGKLKVVTDEAVPRTFLVNCHYQNGMSFAENPDTGNYRTRLMVITFVCHSPYWYDPNETNIIWSDPAASLRYPELVFNDGDVDTWPIMTLSGQINRITITNETTGKYLEWGEYNVSYLGTNVYLYIDCRPGYRNCLVSHWRYSRNGPPRSYGNVYPDLWPTSNINFNLVPGENRISFSIYQTGYDATCSVGFRFLNRYNGI